MSGFVAELARAWERQQFAAVCGARPGDRALPARDRRPRPRRSFTSTRPIIDATADLVCAYKPQFAHYAAYEAEDQLERTIEYIHRTYPGIPVILDAKRGDIGNTAERYAIEAFERYAADAVTVNPYLGTDALEPFLRARRQGRHRSVPHLQPERRRSAGPRDRRPQALPGGRRTRRRALEHARQLPAGRGRDLPARARRSARARRRHAAAGAGSRGAAGRCGRRWCRTARPRRAPGSSSAPRAPSSTRRRGADFAGAARTRGAGSAHADQR